MLGSQRVMSFRARSSQKVSMAGVQKKKRRLTPEEREAIKQRITEIHAELDAMPLVVASAAQLAREVKLDGELTVLRLKLSVR